MVAGVGEIGLLLLRVKGGFHQLGTGTGKGSKRGNGV